MGAFSWVLLTVLRMLRPLFRLLRVVYDAAVTWVFTGIMWFRKRTPLPPVFNTILLLSASQLADNIRKRKMTSVEVVRAFITRISDVNPILNALAQENFTRALQEARRADEKLQQGLLDGSITEELLQERMPFFGVPFTVKETIGAVGLPHSGGLVARVGCLATVDAEIVARMRKSGAILLGNTNISELGMWWESDNRVYGRTNNPYDTKHTPGGSSGGEAALMCACGSPISLGTDTGGSIRTPAFFCGLFGHKPTNGLVSLRGVNVFYDVDTNDVQVAGPLTRHARDLAPVLAIMAGQEGCAKLKLGQKVDMCRLSVFSMDSDGDGVFTSSVTPNLLTAQRAIEQHFLNTYDVNITKVQIPSMRRSFKIWQQKVGEEMPESSPLIMQLNDNKGGINVWTEVARMVLGRGRHTIPSLLTALLENLVGEVRFLKDTQQVWRGKGEPPAEAVPKTVPIVSARPFGAPPEEPEWKTLKMKLQRLLGDNGVLLYPSHPTLAPYHSESFFKPFNFTYGAIFNALGFPVTQVPLGLAPNGLPLGIQVVGGLHQDHVTIAVAEDLEKAFGGWVCPSKIL